MSGKKVSRNAPCPCGSGKKFKHCCIHKNIDWQSRQTTAARRMLPGTPRPRPSGPHGFSALDPYSTIDARLKEIARTAPQPGEWTKLVGSLSESTSDAERIRTYKALRDAGVLPPDSVFFLFGHAIQWMPSEDGEDDLDQAMLAGFRRFGLDEIAALYESDQLEYARRHERGRQFFFGPPDEMLARRLRERGVIE